MIVVLVAAAGAAWESAALKALEENSGTVVLKRCVDVDDLLAAASAGQAEAAVVGIEVPGLDAGAVDLLRRHGVRPVAVVPDDHAEAAAARARRIGIGVLVTEHAVADLPDAVTAVEPPPTSVRADGVEAHDDVRPDAPGRAGRVTVVWGPAGAPGRSTLTVAVGAELARRGHPTVLLDADPQGGSLAQQLGVLDEVSGLLAAARLVGSGVDGDRLLGVRRALGRGLSVVTGLPRADRWAEVRSGTVGALIEAGRAHGDVVVDVGSSLEDDPVVDVGTRPGRHDLTLEALDAADEVLVVGTPDPVGLARLTRGLTDLVPRLGAPPRVVVNRMRGSLGWSRRQVEEMLTGLGPLAGLHVVPDDQAALDRALVAGRTPQEMGDSPFTRAVAELVDGWAAPVPRRRGRR